MFIQLFNFFVRRKIDSFFFKILGGILPDLLDDERLSKRGFRYRLCDLLYLLYPRLVSIFPLTSCLNSIVPLKTGLFFVLHSWTMATPAYFAPSSMLKCIWD